MRKENLGFRFQCYIWNLGKRRIHTASEKISILKMKSLHLLLFLTISFTSFSQDSLHHEFDTFIEKLVEYENSLDSIPVIQYHSCGNYQLKWKTSIQNNSGWNVGSKANLSNLCFDLKQYEKTNKKTSKKKNVYGSYYYSYRYIGNKYVVVTGEAATGSINRTIYYYERKEED